MGAALPVIKIILEVMEKCHFIKSVTLLLVCCLLFGCKPEEVEKYGTIYGAVTDYATGEPVGNANVRLNPRGETTLTGSDGVFQFNNLPSGMYSLSLSKNGYVDLDDDYVIRIESGNTVQRAVQMQKLSSSLQIVDNNGNVIELLDYGPEEGVTQKTFNIFNNGNTVLDYSILAISDWLVRVAPSEGTIGIGDTKPIYAIIDRNMLMDGVNNSNLLITTHSSGGVELAVRAVKPVAPAVKIENVFDVTYNSAKCSGSIISNGGISLVDKGVCYSRLSDPSLADYHVSCGAGEDPFTCTISGLEKNTVYYVRAYASNSVGTAYGEPMSFRTHGIPSVSTGSVTNVAVSSAICSGNVSSDGGSPVTRRGVCWSEMPIPTINNEYNTNGTGLGSFSCDISYLKAHTTYYVRAFAENSAGVSYGEEVSFTTNYSFPTINYNGNKFYIGPSPDYKMNWSMADSYCNNLNIDGLTGWRLPTIDELVEVLLCYYYDDYDRWSSTSGSVGHHKTAMKDDDGIWVDERPNSDYWYVIPIRIIE